MSVVNLETDIQARWVLKALRSTSDPDTVACKDSTLLSKVRGIVDRLSDDRDATAIHRSRNQASQLKAWTHNGLRPLHRL